MVPDGAWVAVITISLVGRMNAKPHLVARIVGAGIQIVTVEGEPRNTLSRLAIIVNGARVAVRTGCLDILDFASPFRQAEVFGAGVAIVAFESAGTDAITEDTVVPGCATVVIVTSSLIGCMDTAHSGIAKVVGADVGIVASE